jgi:hypothetical protein
LGCFSRSSTENQNWKQIVFGDDSLVAEVIDNTTSRGRTLRFLYDGSYEEFRKN